MASKNVTLRIPPLLMDLIEKRVDELGYSSVAKYFISMAFHDLVVSRPHALTVPWANARPSHQDTIIANIAKLREDRKGRLTWLDHQIIRAVKAVIVETDAEIIQERLAELMREEMEADKTAKKKKNAPDA